MREKKTYRMDFPNQDIKSKFAGLHRMKDLLDAEIAGMINHQSYKSVETVTELYGLSLKVKKEIETFDFNGVMIK